MSYLCTRKREQNVGAIAQLVEQRTENPCVPGSIPGGTTLQNANDLKIELLAFFFFSFCPTCVQQLFLLIVFIFTVSWYLIAKRLFLYTKIQDYATYNCYTIF